MSLTNDDYTRLEDALLDSFDTFDGLARMLKRRLDVSLETIVGKADLKTINFRLVEWAKSHGKIDDLILGALHILDPNVKTTN